MAVFPDQERCAGVGSGVRFPLPAPGDYPDAVLSLLEDLGNALPGKGEPKLRAFHELTDHAVRFFPDDTYTIPHEPVESREILNPLKILIAYLESKLADVPASVTIHF
jgi:hypothetical protein